MSCLLIQGSLLFAASNSKDGEKKSKSKVEASASASAAADGSSAKVSASATSPSALSQNFDTIDANLFSTAAIIELPIAISPNTPQSFKCLIPKGYRAFRCSNNASHQHFCKEDAEKQEHEFPMLPLKEIQDKINRLAIRDLWSFITTKLKNQTKIKSPISLAGRDLCQYGNGNRFKIDAVIIELADDLIPHRPESPIPDGHELGASIVAKQKCTICRVKRVAHKHFKKKS